mmetsp:Transcript_8136/g.16392  ORF Transcript_8136/g.16392 Transcript_8136/m.16392 type:complete len:1183 (-) Transcript_8136:1410-4958(-)
MDPSLVRALNIVYGRDVNATQEDRATAHNLVEQFSRTSSTSTLLRFVLTFSTTEESGLEHDILSHFVLHILERELIRTRWTNLVDDDRSQIKDATISLVHSVGQGTSTVLMYKLSAVLASLALQVWPQAWPNLLDELFRFVNLGSIQSKFVCLFIRTLSEEVFEFNDHLAQARRQDLSKCLHVALPSILDYLMQCAQLEKAGTMEALLPAVEAMSAVLSWGPTTILFKKAAPHWLLSFLQHPPLRDRVIQALDILVSRKDSDSKGSEDGFYQLMGDLARMYANNTLIGEQYAFGKQFVSTLVTLGINHFVVSVPKEPNEFEMEQGRLILRVFLALALHDSIICASLALQFWNHLFRGLDEFLTPKLISSIGIPEFTRMFLECIPLRIIRVGNPELSNHPSCEYSREDFESSAEFRAHLYDMRSLATSVIRVASNLMPQAIFFLMQELWLALQLVMLPNSTSSVPTASPIGLPRASLTNFRWDVPSSTSPDWKPIEFNTEHSLFLLIESLCLTIETLMLAREWSAEDEESVCSLAHRLLQQVSYPVNLMFPALAETRMSCIRCCLPLLNRQQELFSATLREILELFLFKSSLDMAEGRISLNLTDEVAEVRSRAASTFNFLISKAASERVTPLVVPLTVSILEVLSREELVGEQRRMPAIRSKDRFNLLEALANASNHITSLDDQASFLEELLAPAVRHLTDPNRQASLLQTPAQFASFLGLSNSCIAVPEYVERRTSLFEEFSLFEVISRCVSSSRRPGKPRESPFQRSLFPLVLRSFFALITCLDGLYEESFRLQLRLENLEEVLSPTPRELAHMLNLESDGLEPLEALERCGVDYPRKDIGTLDAQRILRGLRIVTYDMIGNAIRSGLHADPVFCETTLKVLGNEMKSLSLLQLNDATHRVLKPLFDCAASEGCETALLQNRTNICFIINSLNTRLIEAFASFRTRENEIAEIAHEQSTRFLARSCCDLLLALSPILPATTDQPSPPILSTTGEALYGADDVAEALLSLALTCMINTDSKASKSAAGTLLRMIPHLSDDGDRFKPFILTSLLRACFEAASKPELMETDDISLSIILYLAEKYPNDIIGAISRFLGGVADQRPITSLFIRQAASPKPKKQHRLEVKRLFSETMGLFCGHRSQVLPNIVGPRSKIVVNTPNRPKNSATEGDEAALDTFFGIH